MPFTGQVVRQNKFFFGYELSRLIWEEKSDKQICHFPVPLLEWLSRTEPYFNLKAKNISAKEYILNNVILITAHQFFVYYVQLA